MSLKNVMTKEGEMIVIDSVKEKNWMTKYLHRSGIPFEGADVMGEEEEMDMDKARAIHKEMFGKFPSSQSKLETILAKINA